MKRIANPIKTIDDRIYLNHFDVEYSTLFYTVELVLSGTGWDIDDVSRILEIVEDGVRKEWLNL